MCVAFSGLTALSPSLLCFADRAHPFPPIPPSQEEGKVTMMMMHPLPMGSAETVIVAVRESLQVSFAPQCKKEKKDHRFSVIDPFPRSFAEALPALRTPVCHPGLGSSPATPVREAA